MTCASGWENPLCHGAVGDGVANDGPAFQLAAQAAIAAGKGLWIEPGHTYRIGSVVAISGTINQSLEVRSAGATILCDSPATGIFSIANLYRVAIRGLRFVGVAARLVDCAHVIYAPSCLTIVEDCEFTSLCSSWGMIHAGGIIASRLAFRGAASQRALLEIAGVGSFYGRCSIEDLDAADVGGPHPKIGGATWQVPLVPTVLRAGNSVPLRGGFSQGTLTLRRWNVDENIARAVQIVRPLDANGEPIPGEPIHRVVIEDVDISCSTAPGNTLPAFDVQHVTHLEIRRCIALPYGGQGIQRDAINLRNVKRTIIDRFSCEADSVGVNRIAADSACGSLRTYGMVQGVDYYTIDSDAAMTESLS